MTSSDLALFSYNAHVGYIRDWPAFVSRMQRLRPAVLLAYIDKRADVPRIYELQRLLSPLGTRIVARFKDEEATGQTGDKRYTEDGGFHAEGDDNGWRMSPTTFLDRYGFLGKDGLTLQVLNEPSGYASLPRLVQWVLEVIDLADKRGISLCVLNFGTGHPADKNGMWVEDLDLILKRLSGHPKHLIGLHEYLPGDGWRFGRVLQMVARCTNELQITPPRVVITEWGVDEDHGGSPWNGYKSRGWTGPFYIQTVRTRYDWFYKALCEEGTLLGFCFFSYGNSGGWENFDMEYDEAALDEVERLTPRIVPAPMPAPVPDPIVPALPAPNSDVWVVGMLSTTDGDTVNVRPEPNTKKSPLTTVAGIAIVRTAPTVDHQGWMPIQVGHFYGWISKAYVGDFQPFITVEPPKPKLPAREELLTEQQRRVIDLSFCYVDEQTAFAESGLTHLCMTTIVSLQKLLNEIYAMFDN